MKTKKQIYKENIQYIIDLMNNVDPEIRIKENKEKRLKQQKKEWYEKNKKLKGRKK